MASRIQLTFKKDTLGNQGSIEISEITDTDALKRMFEHLPSCLPYLESVEIFGEEVYRVKR